MTAFTVEDVPRPPGYRPWDVTQADLPDPGERFVVGLYQCPSDHRIVVGLTGGQIGTRGRKADLCPCGAPLAYLADRELRAI